MLVLIIGIVIYAFAKFHSLNNSIKEPLDRDHSQLRQKNLKDGDPMTGRCCRWSPAAIHT
ncbi:MAG: hypothetical protein E7G67_09360 [Staphylococcus sp.]|nr:hypothetical protein [Staphylococcus sp.]